MASSYVVRPGATSSVLATSSFLFIVATSSDALVPSSWSRALFTTRFMAVAIAAMASMAMAQRDHAKST